MSFFSLLVKEISFLFVLLARDYSSRAKFASLCDTQSLFFCLFFCEGERVVFVIEVMSHAKPTCLPL